MFLANFKKVCSKNWWKNVGIFLLCANFAGLCKTGLACWCNFKSKGPHKKLRQARLAPGPWVWQVHCCVFCCFCFNECEQWMYRKSCLSQLMHSPPKQCNPGPLWRHSQLYLNLIYMLLCLQMNFYFRNTLSWLDSLPFEPSFVQNVLMKLDGPAG